jgi:SRSO17 transposase
MNVELQILKHLKRLPAPTVSIIERYCDSYNELFPEVRSYECFKYLHQGIISPIKRKTLPEIAKVVGISSHQSLHHFLTLSPWSVADSLDGEASLFIRTLDKYKLPWVLAIRSNHGVLMPSSQRVRANKWAKFERIFSNQTSEIRYIREIIFGKRRTRTYWEITTAPETMPENSTSFVMTNIQATRSQMKKILGNLYGLRTWVEYSFRQCKQELGWTDYRLTNFEYINKWWEMIMSAYLMISLNTQVFLSLNTSDSENCEVKISTIDLTTHPQWNDRTGWKNVLNNIRLIIQPTLLLWLICPWLEVLPNSYLLRGLHNLIDSINQFSLLPLSG